MCCDKAKITFNLTMDGHALAHKQSNFIGAWQSSIARILLSIIFMLVAAMPAVASNIPIRALHIEAFNLEVADMKSVINQASREHFNTLILGVNGILLRSTPWVAAKHNSWSRSDLVDVANYARQKGMEIVPQVYLLSKQQLHLGRKDKGLLFNAKTYDPSNPEVYETVFPIFDELIELLHPKAIHIGHDEVVGWEAWHYKDLLGPGEKMLPAKLFLEDVKRIHGYLKKKGVETWMWGDMLISPDEFPEMFPRALHGTMPGYGKSLRDSLPKDIVICDWHYDDKQLAYPSLAAFEREGFRVLGATWKESENIRNFSRYAATHGADGMIATTWYHDPKSKDWGNVARIIRESGEAFSKNFPDAR